MFKLTLRNRGLQYCNRCIAPECAMMSFGLRSAVCTCGFILLLGLTTHAPVAHSSPLWLVSLAQRSGVGDCWSWIFLTPARLVCLQRFSRVCWCVYAPCTCMPIHVCPSAHGTHGYDKPRLFCRPLWHMRQGEKCMCLSSRRI